MKYVLGLLALIFICTSQAEADSYSYVNWTSASSGLPGSAGGVIHLTGHDVTVSYTGELTFAQLNNSGTNYWSPTSTFTSPTVSNAPSTADMLALGNNSSNYGGTNHIEFSEPVTNPVLSIVSLGAPGITVQWTFDSPFTLLSQGPSSAWGGSSSSLSHPQPNILQGTEGDGTIEFVGTFSSINFTQSTAFNEYWHSFTVGIPTAIPEPSTLVLVGAGMAALLIKASRR